MVEMIILAGSLLCLALIGVVVEDPKQRVQRFFCWLVFLLLWGVHSISCGQEKKEVQELIRQRIPKLREPKRRRLIMGNEEDSAA